MVEKLAWELAKVRYLRAIIQEAKGDPEKGEEVLAALREALDD